MTETRRKRNPEKKSTKRKNHSGNPKQDQSGRNKAAAKQSSPDKAVKNKIVKKTDKPVKEKKEKQKKEKPKKDKPIYKHPIESTQMQIPIREVLSTGTIVTTDKRYIRIVEVHAGPFILSTDQEKASIIMEFASMLKIGPRNLQIIAMTLPADLTQQIRFIENNIKEETNTSVRDMAAEFRDNLQEEQKYSVSRRFFIVFQLERGSVTLKRMTIEEVEQSLNSMENTITSALAACGNDVVFVPDDERYTHTLEILYTMLNRKKSIFEPFEDHMQKVIYRYFYHYGEKEYYIPPAEYFAPDSLMYMSYNKIEIDNTYYSYLYIPSNGYPSQVEGGWLTPFLNVTPGIDITIHLRRLETASVLNKLRRHINYNRSDARNSSDISEAYENAENSVYSGLYLKEGLSSHQDFYYMSVILTVSAETPELLDKKITLLKTMANERDITMYETAFDEEQAFYSCLPLNYIDPSLFNRSRQNMLTIDAAAMYPLTTAEYNEEGGVFLGSDNTNKSLVVLNLFSPKLTNSNFFVCGTSGSGKTFSVLLIAMRTRMIHIPVYIIAPEKEHEFRRVCTAMGGQFITIAMGSKNTINIMEIRRRANADIKLLDGSYEELSYLSEKIESVKIFIKLLAKDITIEEQQLLDDALYKTYKKFGITRDNNSLWKDEKHREYKKMPILSDLRETLGEIPQAQRLYTILGMFTQGSGRVFNGQTNVNLNNQFTVISTEHLSGDMMPLGIYLAFDFLLSKIKENRLQKKVLIVDEFWKMNQASQEMLETAKTCRGYTCSLGLATQQMRDIMKVDNGIYGEGILNNCATKILLRMEANDADNVQQILNLTDDDKRVLVNQSKGNAMIISGRMRMTLHFDAYETEYNLITTNAEDQKRIISQMKKKKELTNIDTSKADEEGYLVVDGMLVKVESDAINTVQSIGEDYSSFRKQGNERMIKYSDEDVQNNKPQQPLSISLDELIPKNIDNGKIFDKVKELESKKVSNHNNADKKGGQPINKKVNSMMKREKEKIKVR